MSAVEAGQMSAAKTGQMSAVETRQMYSIKTGQRRSILLKSSLVLKSRHLHRNVPDLGWRVLET